MTALPLCVFLRLAAEYALSEFGLHFHLVVVYFKRSSNRSNEHHVTRGTGT